MSRKFRKALQAEIKSGDYYTPQKGNKIYVFAYGSEPLFTYETEVFDVMTKEIAFHIVNDILTENGEPPKTNIKKISYFRVA